MPSEGETPRVAKAPALHLVSVVVTCPRPRVETRLVRIARSLRSRRRRSRPRREPGSGARLEGDPVEREAQLPQLHSRRCPNLSRAVPTDRAWRCADCRGRNPRRAMPDRIRMKGGASFWAYAVHHPAYFAGPASRRDVGVRLSARPDEPIHKAPSEGPDAFLPNFGASDPQRVHRRRPTLG
jgi:hypothetical protein